MIITSDIKYIGVNDRKIDLFEGLYPVPNGMSYNSYVILDEKIAVMDTVDGSFTDEWLKNLSTALNGKEPSYLIVQHMEPDHSASICDFIESYPNAKIVSSKKSFDMMKGFFGRDFSQNGIIVGDNSILSLGKHTLTFITAPMVHWPEVIVTYDSYSNTLFSADAFGKFGALDTDEDWACEARRYYFGIVGKYGVQVQGLLKKIAPLEIKQICPLHGPVLNENLDYYLKLYSTWSSYEAEDEGVTIAYTSVYGNTKRAVLMLADMLKEKGCACVVYDLARCQMSEAVEDAFRYSKLVLATTTYNAEIFPFMREFINHLTSRGYSKRSVAFMENGSWMPMATKIMTEMMSKCKDITYLKSGVRIMSSLDGQSKAQLVDLANEICK